MKLFRIIMLIISFIIVLGELLVVRSYNLKSIPLVVIPIGLIILNKKGIYIPNLFEIWLQIHSFIAIAVGSVFNGYEIIPTLDLYLHGLFGLMICFLPLYVILKSRIIMPFHLKMLGCFFISMGFAAMWEIYEFSMDFLFNLNMQKTHIGTGVNDTMEDFIVNFIGASIFVLIFTIDRYKFKSRLMKKILM